MSDAKKKGPGAAEPAPEPARRADVHLEVNRCPFCHEEIAVAAQDLEWVACSKCLGRHHRACWDEGNGCSSCGGKAPLAHAPAPAGDRPKAGLIAAVFAAAAAVVVGLVLFVRVAPRGVPVEVPVASAPTGVELAEASPAELEVACAYCGERVQVPDALGLGPVPPRWQADAKVCSPAHREHFLVEEARRHGRPDRQIRYERVELELDGTRRYSFSFEQQPARAVVEHMRERSRWPIELEPALAERRCSLEAHDLTCRQVVGTLADALDAVFEVGPDRVLRIGRAPWVEAQDTSGAPAPLFVLSWAVEGVTTLVLERLAAELQLRVAIDPALGGYTEHMSFATETIREAFDQVAAAAGASVTTNPEGTLEVRPLGEAAGEDRAHAAPASGG